MRIVLLVLMALMAACAADPQKVEQVAETEAERLAAPSRPLSEFASFRLEPMTFSDEIKAEEGKMEEAGEFEGNLTTKIQPLLDQWNQAGTGDGTLLIKPDLVKLRVVSGGARFWAGGLAGDSYIDMNLALVAEETGEVLSKVRVSRTASGIAGGWSVGKSDQNLDDYIVSIVHEYLEDNY